MPLQKASVSLVPLSSGPPGHKGAVLASNHHCVALKHSGTQPCCFCCLMAQATVVLWQPGLLSLGQQCSNAGHSRQPFCLPTLCGAPGLCWCVAGANGTLTQTSTSGWGLRLVVPL